MEMELTENRPRNKRVKKYKKFAHKSTTLEIFFPLETLAKFDKTLESEHTKKKMCPFKPASNVAKMW